MRSKGVEEWIQELTTGRLREPLAYVAKIQVAQGRTIPNCVLARKLCVKFGKYELFGSFVSCNKALYSIHSYFSPNNQQCGGHHYLVADVNLF